MPKTASPAHWQSTSQSSIRPDPFAVDHSNPLSNNANCSWLRIWITNRFNVQTLAVRAVAVRSSTGGQGSWTWKSIWIVSLALWKFFSDITAMKWWIWTRFVPLSRRSNRIVQANTIFLQNIRFQFGRFRQIKADLIKQSISSYSRRFYLLHLNCTGKSAKTCGPHLFAQKRFVRSFWAFE